MALNVKDKAALLGGLTEVIEKYFEDVAGDFSMPWRGDNTNALMAQAALTVLEGIADTETYLIQNDMLNDEDDA